MTQSILSMLVIAYQHLHQATRVLLTTDVWRRVAT